MAEKGDEYFKEQKEWSRRKLAIVRGYLDGFTKILGSSTTQSCVYFVDGFAGAGKYEDGAKGSPLLSAELAQSYEVSQKAYHLNCINVEEDPENYGNLESATAPYSGLVQNYQGSFSSNLPAILSNIGKCPALFFLDPFGVKGVDWVDVSRIIHRKGATDLWIRFDHKQVQRLSGFFKSGSRGADSKFLNLLKLYGINQPDVLYRLLQGKTPEERLANALALYVNRLEEEFRNSRNEGYSVAFPIVSINDETKYHLVFASAHPKAAILASQTVYSAERNRPKERQDYLEKKTGQPLLISLEPSDDEISLFIAEQLCSDIRRLCAGKQLSRNGIFMQLIRDDDKKWFGHFSGAQLNKALSLLEEKTNPAILSKDGPNSKEQTVFIFR